jgi:hypothetical protein
MLRYCDGASFAGEGYDAASGLYFRGQRIFNAAVQYFLSIGMASADQVLLTGTSAGALAVVLHCDQFSSFFAGRSTTVKCLSDAGFFLDAYVHCAQCSRLMHILHLLLLFTCMPCCMQRGCLWRPYLENLLWGRHSHAWSGPEPAQGLHCSSRRHLGV